MGPDNDVHQHYTEAPSSGKLPRRSCIHCGFNIAKHTTAQRKHLLNCTKYHEWAAANNEALIIPTAAAAYDRQRAATGFGDLAERDVGSYVLSQAARTGAVERSFPERGELGSLVEDDNEDAEDAAEPEQVSRPGVTSSMKNIIDGHLARGIYRGGHDFDIFEKNDEWKAMFELLGYTPPTMDMIRGKLLDDYYRALRAKGAGLGTASKS